MTSESNRLSLGKLILSLLYPLIFPSLLLFLSGDWSWAEGLLFTAWFLALCFTTILYLYFSDPALLAERYRRPGTANHERWDQYVVYGLLVGFVIWIIIMPLDAKRFGWTVHFPLWLKVLGGFLLLISFFFFFRSFADNTFASPLVRIQTDRKQQVVSKGVYSIVRHPMYLGGILMFIGGPLLLGSQYGLIIGLALGLLLAVRIVGEENILNKELKGYADYKKKVKFRLFPFIW